MLQHMDFYILILNSDSEFVNPTELAGIILIFVW